MPTCKNFNTIDLQLAGEALISCDKPKDKKRQQQYNNSFHQCRLQIATRLQKISTYFFKTMDG